MKSEQSFINLGFGTVAYFDIYNQLVVLYVIMLLLALPSIYLFAFYEGGNRDNHGWFHSLTIGNLGFSKAICTDVSLSVNKLSLQ